MSKLQEIKDKLSALRDRLAEKINNISFLKKILEKIRRAPIEEPQAEESGKEDDKKKKVKKPSISIQKLYREGDTSTRIQVVLVFLFSAGAAILLAFVLVNLAFRFKVKLFNDPGNNNKQIKDAFVEFQKKAEAKAVMISLGRISANTFLDGGKEAILTADLWIKVSDSDAAAFAQKNETVLNDKASDAFSKLYRDKVSFLTESGKNLAKNALSEQLTKAFPHGKVVDVFFFNLVVQ